MEASMQYPSNRVNYKTNYFSRVYPQKSARIIAKSAT